MDEAPPEEPVDVVVVARAEEEDPLARVGEAVFSRRRMVCKTLSRSEELGLVSSDERVAELEWLSLVMAEYDREEEVPLLDLGPLPASAFTGEGVWGGSRRRRTDKGPGGGGGGGGGGGPATASSPPSSWGRSS
jgi:hypothetical protein